MIEQHPSRQQRVAEWRWPFEDKMARLTAELREQTQQSAKLDQLIWANLEDIGYGG